MPRIETRGRLAPTPSGWLHLGNARSFLLAWLWARKAGGRVIMRVEDIDLGRVKEGLRDQALEDIAWLGLDWDDGPHAGDPPGEFDQSMRFALYRRQLDKLISMGKAYPCVCSRKDVEEASSAPHGDDGPIYPGTCRGKYRTALEAEEKTGVKPCWRYALNPGEHAFHDEIKGDVRVAGATLGDFVLWRRDALPSYQLACAVDDGVMGVTQVLRGDDLILSTVRQLALYRDFGLTPPQKWAHVPLMKAPDGRRLAKRDGDLSLKALREKGVRPQRVVGLCAYSCGVIAAPRDIAAANLVETFDIHGLKDRPMPSP
ncbi:MAG: tRNA glutamyl-Q(34) synthetase GluQRS [Planctomycetes bacterium]|nr:tRNA glutamyl-Q(34) synthetase GluQRS [Planctomycetota bacterium]